MTGQPASGPRVASDAGAEYVFRELRTTGASLDDLKTAIGEDLAAFNADSTTEVLSKYLGSSIHVVPG